MFGKVGGEITSDSEEEHLWWFLGKMVQGSGFVGSKLFKRGLYGALYWEYYRDLWGLLRGILGVSTIARVGSCKGPGQGVVGSLGCIGFSVGTTGNTLAYTGSQPKANLSCGHFGDRYFLLGT